MNAVRAAAFCLTLLLSAAARADDEDLLDFMQGVNENAKRYGAQAAPAPPTPEQTELLAQAEKGSAEAQFKLGCTYYEGVGEHDYAAAMKWFKRAADQGHAGALQRIGYMHHMCSGVPCNEELAVEYWRKAGERGDTWAQRLLGDHYSYESADGKVKANFPKALEWYRKAADRGDTQAQGSLAYLYRKGALGTPDYTQSLYWNRRAAANGLVPANTELGELYEKGLGVDRDLVAAYGWYLRGARGYEDHARAAVKRLQQILRPAEIERAEKLSKEPLVISK